MRRNAAVVAERLLEELKEDETGAKIRGNRDDREKTNLINI